MISILKAVMSNIFGRPLDLHIDFCKLLDIDETDQNAIQQAKQEGSNIWNGLIRPSSDEPERDVLVCNTKSKPHASLAISPASRTEMVILEIDHQYRLRASKRTNAKQVSIYVDNVEIEQVCKTRLTNKQLGLLALWCKPDQYKLIKDDCVKFVEGMYKAIATQENNMDVSNRKRIVASRNSYLKEKEAAKDRLKFSRLGRLVSKLPFGNRLDQIYVYAFPIVGLFLLAALIFKRGRVIFEFFAGGFVVQFVPLCACVLFISVLCMAAFVYYKKREIIRSV